MMLWHSCTCCHDRGSYYSKKTVQHLQAKHMFLLYWMGSLDAQKHWVPHLAGKQGTNVTSSRAAVCVNLRGPSTAYTTPTSDNSYKVIPRHCSDTYLPNLPKVTANISGSQADKQDIRPTHQVPCASYHQSSENFRLRVSEVRINTDLLTIRTQQ